MRFECARPRHGSAWGNKKRALRVHMQYLEKGLSRDGVMLQVNFHGALERDLKFGSSGGHLERKC